MKRVLSALLAILMLLLAGCNQLPAEPTDSTVQTQDDTTQLNIPDKPLVSVSLPAKTDLTYAENKTVLSAYTHQQLALIHSNQQAADKIIVDFLNRMDSYDASAATLTQSATADYTGQENWIPYSQSILYSPKRIDQNVLSLFGHQVTYSGGTHPQQACSSANYDMVTGDVLTLASILTGSEKAESVANLVILALQKQQAEKRLFTGFETLVKSSITADPTHNEAWYFSNTGLCFYFAPYEIAPYTSGVITAEVPYEQLTGLLYNGCFPAEQDVFPGDVFAEKITGTLSSDLDLPYKQIPEVILDQDGEQVLLHTDGVLQNVSIHVITGPDADNEESSNGYTVFAAEYISPNDAIMLQCDLPAGRPNLVLRYVSEGANRQLYISQSGEDGSILLLENLGNN